MDHRNVYLREFALVFTVNKVHYVPNLPWTFPYGPKDSLAFGFNSADTSQEPEGKGIQQIKDFQTNKISVEKIKTSNSINN